MTEASDEKLKFWAVLVAVMLGVSVAVLLIDMTIKAAILEESNALRRTLLGIQDDRPTEASNNGASHNSNSSSSVLDIFPAGMENGDVATGDKTSSNGTSTRGKRTRTQPRTQGDSGEIPPGA